jgi:glucose 1-dehydrogenase
MRGLQDKVALVTGGSSGIGQAIAIRLGEEGANVAINYVGPPEGAISTKEAIEHGVEICMKKMAEAAAGRSSSPPTYPTSRPWTRCSTG